MESRVELPRIKIAFCGAKGVGKSTIFNQYFYRANGKPEGSASIAEKQEKTNGGKDVTIQGTDSEEIALQSPPDVFFLVFNRWNRESFNFVDEKISELKREYPQSKFILVSSCPESNAETPIKVTNEDITAFLTKHVLQISDFITINQIHTPAFTKALFKLAASKGLYAKQSAEERERFSAQQAKPSVSACFFMKTMKIPTLLTVVGDLLLLAGVAAVVTGTCGAGALGIAGGLALGLTIGGGTCAGVGSLLMGAGMWGLFRGCRRDGAEEVVTADSQARRGSTIY